GVTEQAASGRNGYLKVVAAKAGKILGAELLDQQPLRCLKFKFPWAASSHPFAILSQFRQRKMIADQQLRRIKPLQLSQCGLQALNFQYQKTTAGHIQRRDAEGIQILVDSNQQVVAAGVKQCLVAHRTGRYDAYDFPLYRAFCGSRIADLLADSD